MSKKLEAINIDKNKSSYKCRKWHSPRDCKANVKYHNCDGIGHFFRECRAPISKCEKCGRLRHLAKFCRTFVAGQNDDVKVKFDFEKVVKDNKKKGKLKRVGLRAEDPTPQFSKSHVHLNTTVNTIQQNCFFTTAKCEKVNFQFLVDTGSVASWLSKATFDRMGIALSKLQRVTTTLSAADGSNIEVVGKIKLKFSMASKIFEN